MSLIRISRQAYLKVNIPNKLLWLEPGRSESKDTCESTSGGKSLSGQTSADRDKYDVPGLSENVYKLPDKEIRPGVSKDGEYKNVEYFCYHSMSVFEAEVELKEYRLPQPSTKKKMN